MDPVPTYLKSYIDVDKEKSNDSNLEGKVKCSCGCQELRLKIFAEKSDEEPYESISDCDGYSVIGCDEYKNGFALKILGECSKCKNQFDIFDISKYGFEGFVTKPDYYYTPNDNELESNVCPKCGNNLFEVGIALEVEDKEQFMEECVECEPDKYTPEDYVNAFNWIVISLKCTECSYFMPTWLNEETS